MLDLDTRSEANALLHHESIGDDPEVVAQDWIDATMAEFRSVVSTARKIREVSPKWAADTVSAHRWLRRNEAHRCGFCSAVCYNDGGVSFDPITNKPHTCVQTPICGDHN